MKPRLLLIPLLVFLAALPVRSFAEEPAAAPAPAATAAQTDLTALVEKIKAKLNAGTRTAEGLKPEIEEFDVLLAKYKDQKTEDVAQIALMKALLYIQVLGDETQGREILAALKKDFPGTKPAAAVDRILVQLDRQAKAEVTKAALVGKAAPELHFKWSSQDGLKKLSDLKGRVVVLDFWATWCGPCIASFPQVREHVAHFKDSPVTFLGVTSIQGFVANMGPRIDTKGDEAKEIGLMPEFMKQKEMTWPIAISEEEVFNPDYGIQGIPYVAIIAPDGTVRHAGLHPGNPASDIAGKVEAILKEFNLPVPAKS